MSDSESGLCEKNILCHVTQTPVTISRLYALAFLHSEKPTPHTNRDTTEMATLNADLHGFTPWQESALPRGYILVPPRIPFQII
jgi:hypothetical protein